MKAALSWAFNRLGVALLVVFHLLGPNLPFWLLGHWYTFNRPCVNLDYMFPAILLMAGYRSAGCLIYALIMLIDTMLGVLTIFFNTGEYLSFSAILSAMERLQIGYAWGVILSVPMLMFVAGGFLRTWYLPRRIGLIVTTTIITVILAIADIYNGSSIILPGSLLHWNVDIAYSSGMRLLRKAMTARGVFDAAPLPAVGSASGRYLSELGNGLQPDMVRSDKQNLLNYVESCLRERRNVIYVVVESLGILKADRDRDGLFAPLLGLGNHFDIVKGEVSSYGGTVSGELRELAWLRVSKIDLTHVNVSRLGWVLPKLYTQIGYETHAYHGFYSAIFRRDEWYPAIGFARAIFLDQMLAANPQMPRTGVVHYGAPDTYVSSLIHNDLKTIHNPFFVYWMTLTGHLPVNMPYAKIHEREVTLPYLRDEPEVIRAHEVIEALVIRSLYGLLVRRDMPPFDIVLVGDHPPKFWQSDLKSRYIDSKVPYIILRRR